jgi:hypothetical protein
VVSLLVAGVWFNRRKNEGEYEVLQDQEDHLAKTRQVLGWPLPSRSTGRFRHNLASRLIAYFPYLREVVIWLLIYLVSAFKVPIAEAHRL